MLLSFCAIEIYSKVPTKRRESKRTKLKRSKSKPSKRAESSKIESSFLIKNQTKYSYRELN